MFVWAQSQKVISTVTHKIHTYIYPDFGGKICHLEYDCALKRVNCVDEEALVFLSMSTDTFI